MDLTFHEKEGTFNYRVAALIINDGKLLITRDSPKTHYFLPGGRVKMFETLEEAMLRELKEELHVHTTIIRPVWLHQAFFIQNTNHEQYHEQCVYFLVNAKDFIDAYNQDDFILADEDNPNKSLYFRWASFYELQELRIFPEFIKTKIHEIPEHLCIISE